ncbi:hypothetical protein QJS10_CPB12g00134 [Acorus calamus]|uniref:Uncharacterized protein n=1 Tax=Acorus calamus TaxID=4465 RepID=A0AAV9DMC0_ACOCL|nr:hypothetical protein QJS10_CPB12g00134 [Acorus calamus]
MHGVGETSSQVFDGPGPYRPKSKMGPFHGLALIVLQILTRSPSPTQSTEPGSNFVELRCGNRMFHNARMTAIYFTDTMENIYIKV